MGRGSEKRSGNIPEAKQAARASFSYEIDQCRQEVQVGFHVQKELSAIFLDDGLEENHILQ